MIHYAKSNQRLRLMGSCNQADRNILRSACASFTGACQKSISGAGLSAEGVSKPSEEAERRKD